MPITDSKLMDIIIDSVYTDATRTQLAEKHNVDPTELQQLYTGSTWNQIRERVLTSIAVHRVATAETNLSVNSDQNAEKPTRTQPSKTQASQRKKT